MKKILKIPVIGPVLRWIIALVKLPVRFDALFFAIDQFKNEFETLETQVLEQKKRIEHLQMQNDHIGKLQQEIINRHEQLSEKHEQLFRNHQSTNHEIVEKINEPIRLMQRHGEILQAHQATMEQCVKDIVDLRENGLYRFWENAGKLERLNRELSIHQTLWGPKERLHISELSAVNSCFFNTNSGHIYIGQYTFSGSDVRILAGSHDMNLSGFLRRDSEIVEGCDIHIGEGVWLASNCTILGPCEIGDNAVIASGAVVVPGTRVLPNTLYAGIPAKFVKKITVDDNIDSESVRNALDRAKGILFYSGWTEKRYLPYRDNLICGHWMNADNAIIYTTSDSLRLFCHVDSKEDAGVILEYNDGTIEKIIENNEYIDINFETKGTNIHYIEVINKNTAIPIFVSTDCTVNI